MVPRWMTELAKDDPYLEWDEKGHLRVKNPVPAIDFHVHLGNPLIIPGMPYRLRSKPKDRKNYPLLEGRVKYSLERVFYGTYPEGRIRMALQAAVTVPRAWWALWEATLDNLLPSMERNHIRYSVALPLEFPDTDNSLEITDLARERKEIIPFCSVHPYDKYKRNKLAWFRRNGARGLKLHPKVQGVHPRDDDFLELIMHAEHQGLVTIIDCGRTAYEERLPWLKKHFKTLDYGRISDLASAVMMAGFMPVILAHAGGADFGEALALAEHFPNVYLEVSTQPPSHIRIAINRLGPDRVLFGSNWPLYPQEVALAAVLHATRGQPVVRRKVLYENAARLLGFPHTRPNWLN